VILENRSAPIIFECLSHFSELGQNRGRWESVVSHQLFATPTHSWAVQRESELFGQSASLSWERRVLSSLRLEGLAARFCWGHRQVGKSCLGSASSPDRASSWLCLHAFSRSSFCHSCSSRLLRSRLPLPGRGRGRGRASDPLRAMATRPGAALSISFNLNPELRTLSPGNESDSRTSHPSAADSVLAFNFASLFVGGRWAASVVFLLCPFARVLLAASCLLLALRRPRRSTARQLDSPAHYSRAPELQFATRPRL